MLLIYFNCFSHYWVHFPHTLFLDVDECATNNGGCNHTCANKQGTFQCSCDAGYSLDANNKTCSGNVLYVFTGLSKK